MGDTNNTEETYVPTPDPVAKCVDEAIAKGLVDPASITEYLLQHLRAAELQAVLITTLRALVRLRISRVRNRGLINTKKLTVPKVTPTFQSNNRATRIRNHFLKYPVCFLFGENIVWKPLGDCNADELELVAQHRIAQANSLMSIADTYLRLAKVVKDSGKDTVYDLSDAELEEFYANNTTSF